MIVRPQPVSEPQAMEPSTKHQILDAAERLFAEFGVDATSVRAVTSTAGVHLAAVNYHFGSKDGLVQAVFARRLEPLNAERLAALAELLQRCPEPDLDDLLRALFEPALRMADQPGGTDFLRLLGRLHTDPEAFGTLGSVLELFGEVRARFVPQLTRCLPELAHDELCWRLHFTMGAMANAMTSRAVLRWMSDGAAGDEGAADVADHLIRFVGAGLRGAPAAKADPEI